MGTVDALLVKRVSRGSRGIQRDFREVQGVMIEQYKGYEIKGKRQIIMRSDIKLLPALCELE